MKIIEKIKEGLKNFGTMLDKVDVPNEDNSEKLLTNYPDLMMASSNADSFAKSIEYRPEKQKRSNQSISIKGIAKNEISKDNHIKTEKEKIIEPIEENQRER